jgi:ribosomal protein S18 acetylase RimI-like enzyme
MSKPEFQVVPIAEEHIAGFYATFDSVAREERYLGRLKAPPIEETTDWVRGNIRKGVPQFVALVDGRVVGWCDVRPELPETMAHGGVLGMGILEDHRGRGIGRALMSRTLEVARKTGLARVELTVREDNLRAKALYEKFGFTVEGVKRKAARVDGRHYDLFLMSLLFES